MAGHDDTLLTFPCEFPIKIMGVGDGDLRGAVATVVAAQSVETVSVSERPSRGGNYLAITLTVLAQSRTQLDDLYRGLNALDSVRVVL